MTTETLQRSTALAAIALAALSATGCAGPGAAERPRYAVVERGADFEVRDYPACLVVEAEVAGPRGEAANEALRLIDAFLSGANRGARAPGATAPPARSEGTKLARTAPVMQTRGGASRVWAVQRMLPSRYALEDLPEPLDTRVSFRVLAPRRVAVRAWSGSPSEAKENEEAERLHAAFARAQLRPGSEPIWARYDDRTEEVWIEIAPSAPPGQ